jgi:hypothetical protein
VTSQPLIAAVGLLVLRPVVLSRPDPDEQASLVLRHRHAATIHKALRADGHKWHASHMRRLSHMMHRHVVQQLQSPSRKPTCLAQVTQCTLQARLLRCACPCLKCAPTPSGCLQPRVSGTATVLAPAALKVACRATLLVRLCDHRRAADWTSRFMRWRAFLAAWHQLIVTRYLSAQPV